LVRASRLPTRLPCLSSFSSGVICTHTHACINLHATYVLIQCSGHGQSIDSIVHRLLVQQDLSLMQNLKHCLHCHSTQPTADKGPTLKEIEHECFQLLFGQEQTSSTSLTAFSSSGRASSMADVAVSAASNTLLRPLESIWRAILVQMYTRSSSATPRQQWRC